MHHQLGSGDGDAWPLKGLPLGKLFAHENVVERCLMLKNVEDDRCYFFGNDGFCYELVLAPQHRVMHCPDRRIMLHGMDRSITEGHL